MAEDKLFRLDLWSKLEELIRPSRNQSRIVTLNSVRLRKLNDHVYEVDKPCAIDHGGRPFCVACKPAERPSVEIVFFHGLQLESSDEPHVTTWLSRDKSDFWLNWLRDEIPDARILTVRYDASVEQTEREGRMEMFLVVENLVACLTGMSADVGKEGCPVVLVGHCLGGLVMKAVCDFANTEVGRVGVAINPKRDVEDFLHSVKGVFYYATPHHGVELPDLDSHRSGVRAGPFLQDMAPLNSLTARRNEAFRQLRRNFGWKAAAVAADRNVALKTFDGFIIHVPEPSTRYDTDALGYYTVGADHFDVSRPVDKTCGSFQRLREFVRDIVKTDKLQRDWSSDKPLPSEVVGVEDNLQKISEELKAAERLAIVGLGGIGKTTIMGILHDKMSRGFDYTCFVKDVKMVTGKEGSLCSLKEIIAKHLLFNGRNVDQPFDWGRLRGRKVLMMLDDVDSQSHIIIFKEFEGFSHESRLIVTSREMKFLQDENFVLYKMGCLKPPDAELLLCRHAFRQDRSPTGFEEHVRNMSQRLGNLPLALRVAGACLFTQDEDYWIETYYSISQASSLDGKVDDGLWSVFERIYASLPAREKEMFLDIATCYHGERLKWVKLAWKYSDWASPHTGWQHLYNKCLVTEDRYGNVSMHELLRNYGRSKARPGNPRETSSHSRIFDIDMANEVIRKVEGPIQERPKVKLMRLKERLDQKEVDVYHGIGILSNLEVLWLDGVRPSIVPETYSRDYQRPAQLTFLFLRDRSDPLLTVPVEQICRFGTLRCLILSSVMLAELSLGQLRCLEYLEIKRCKSLKIIPAAICSLTSLEHLLIGYCWDLEIISPEIGELRQLKFLRISGCHKLQALPNSIAKLRTLKNLKLSYCEEMTVVVRNLWELPSLTDLHIEACRVLDWYEVQDRGHRRWELLHMKKPISFSDFQSTRGVNGLVISGWDDARHSSCYCGHIEGLLGAWRETRPHFLHVFLDKRGDHFPSLPLEGFEELRKLEIDTDHMEDWAHDLELRRFVGGLPKLQEVVFTSCSNVEAILETSGLPQALQKLQVVDCQIEKALPTTFGQFTALRELHIVSCDCFEALPATIGQLTALRELRIKRCRRVQALPATVGQLPMLEVLRLELSSLEWLPGSVLQAKALRKLAITKSPGIRVYGSTTWDLPNLEVLKLGCPHVNERFYSGPENSSRFSKESSKNFWKTVGTAHFPNLRHLSVLGSKALKAFDPFGQFPELAQLKVAYCDLNKFPELWRQLGSLKRLEIAHCFYLEELPDCPNLEQLHLSHSHYLTKLVGHARSLVYVTIRGIRNSAQLVRLVGESTSVEDLTFSTAVVDMIMMGMDPHCYNMLEADDALDSLSQISTLKHVEINNYGWRALPQSFEKLVRLERLTLRDYAGLNDLLESLGTLTSLKQVSIESSRWTEIELWKLRHPFEDLDVPWDSRPLKRIGGQRIDDDASIGKHSGLEYLEIRDFDGFTELPASTAGPLRLQKLAMRQCKTLQKTPHLMVQHLDYLEISDCPEIKQLPILGEGVKKVVIQRCKRLEEWRPSLDHVRKMQELEFTHEDWRVPFGRTFLTTVFNNGELVSLAKAGQSLREAATAFLGDRKG